MTSTYKTTDPIPAAGPSALVPAAAPPVGPILHLRGHDADGLHLAALIYLPEGAPGPGPLDIVPNFGGGGIAPVRIGQMAGIAAWRFDFTLPQSADGYRVAGCDHPVRGALSGDLRLAFVSCNGEEHGDLHRDPGERNRMWQRLLDDHRDRPFALLLQGGDQIYADEATRGHPLSQDWPDAVAARLDAAQTADLERHLEARFVARYLSVLGPDPCRRLMAEVPSLSIWDDHDICDGWGSLPDRATRSDVGQALFRVARRACLLFQHGAAEADIPALFWEPTGANLGWRRDLPGLTLFAPDLRSERQRRRIMGPAGWAAMEALHPPAPDPARPHHTIMVSSVPLLGPRLSLLEGVMTLIPRMQHYEDDLRDQWQSRTHRTEWRRMLTEILRLRRAGPVTILSGEIHLATRAEMGAPPMRLHQLVGSGISHRAPPVAYARALGALAGLGDAPLEGHPVRIRRLPGQRHRYAAERNYLVMTRTDGRWTAHWHLERSGLTPPLDLEA